MALPNWHSRLVAHEKLRQRYHLLFRRWWINPATRIREPRLRNARKPLVVLLVNTEPVKSGTIPRRSRKQNVKTVPCLEAERFDDSRAAIRRVNALLILYTLKRRSPSRSSSVFPVMQHALAFSRPTGLFLVSTESMMPLELIVS